jgi:hypothetical protein
LGKLSPRYFARVWNEIIVRVVTQSMMREDRWQGWQMNSLRSRGHPHWRIFAKMSSRVGKTVRKMQQRCGDRDEVRGVIGFKNIMTL